jgi:hypothetical protein
MKTLPIIVAVIAAATCLTGLVQMVAPGFVLSQLNAESAAASNHFFAIIGMFMLLFGGATLHALMRPASLRLVLLWASLQKFGAALAVGLGVGHGLFSSLGLLVAGFDLLSGVLMLVYRARVRQNTSAEIR